MKRFSSKSLGLSLVLSLLGALTGTACSNPSDRAVALDRRLGALEDAGPRVIAAPAPTPAPTPAPAPAVALTDEQSRNLATLAYCTPGLPGYAVADCDGDTIPNSADACPAQNEGTEALMKNANYARRGCLDTDGDQDGVGDSQDVCPTAKRGEHEDLARRGCPSPDSDNDGVFDNDDQCRLIPVHSAATPTAPAADTEHAGCPVDATRDPDSDGDGVRDERDECPHEVAGDDPHPARLGCPDVDTDHDGRPDRWDGCPRIPVWSQRTQNAPEPGDYPGCPEHTTPTNDAPPAGTPTPTTTDAGAPNAPPVAPVVAPVPAPAPVATTTPTNSGRTLIGSTLYIEIEQRLGATRAMEFAREANAADVRNHSANDPCADGELYCFRRANDNVVLPACDVDAPQLGCVTAGHPAMIQSVCRPGTEAFVVVVCGRGMLSCDPTTFVGSLSARSANRHHRR